MTNGVVAPSSRTARRSTALKELDEAIRIRHEPAAKKALIEWIKAHNKKGKDWHTSVRNKDGVVEALYKELGILGSEVATPTRAVVKRMTSLPK